MHVLLQIRRSHELFCLYNFVKHMKCELSFTLLDLENPNFSVVHQSDCDVFILVLKPTISTYFSAVNFDSDPDISTVRFLIHDPNSAFICGRDDGGIIPALRLSIRHMLMLTNTTKLKAEKADYEPSRKTLDFTHAFPSCSFLEISICVNAYIVKITLSTYVIRLYCSIEFCKDALLFSLSANAMTMM